MLGNEFQVSSSWPDPGKQKNPRELIRRVDEIRRRLIGEDLGALGVILARGDLVD